MACGCRGRGNRPPQQVQGTPTAAEIVEVYVGGEPTGRRFTSVVAAQSYAAKVGGEVRPA